MNWVQRVCIGIFSVVLLNGAFTWAQTQVESSMFYGQSWAVVIGINEYDQFPDLRYAVNDARAVGARFKRMGFHVVMLENEEATKQNILDALKFQLAEVVGPDDRIVIFYSGHGAAGRLTQTGGELGFLVPSDGKRFIDGEELNIMSERILIDSDHQTFVRNTNFISTEELRQIFDNLPAKHILSIIDGCYSGFIDPTSYTRLSHSERIQTVRSGEGGRGFDAIVPETPISASRETPQKTDTNAGLTFTSLDTIQILTAGSSGEKAFEQAGHGIFTLYLLKALDGAARFTRNSCLLTASELAAYLKRSVYQASSNRQNPLFNRISGEGEVVFVMPSCHPVTARHTSPPMYDEEWQHTQAYRGPQNYPYRLPTEVETDRYGNLYVLDTKQGLVFKFDSYGRHIPEFFQLTALSPPWWPTSMTVRRNGDVWIFYSWLGETSRGKPKPGGQIVAYTQQGVATSSWDDLNLPISGCTERGEIVELPHQAYIALDIEDNLIITDRQNGEITKCDWHGNLLYQWGRYSEAFSDYKTVPRPGGVAVDIFGYIYVSNLEGHGIQKFFNNEWIPSWPNTYVKDKDPYFFNAPQGMAIDENLFVYVADTENHRVKKYTSNGERLLTYWGRENARKGKKYGEFNQPRDVSVSQDGALIYVADTGNRRIQRFWVQ